MEAIGPERSRPPVLEGSWSLVGREAELRELVTALDGLRGVVLHGPAGVGKSRLADEALASVRRPCHVERFRATAAAASLPFGAFASLPAVFAPPAAGPTGLLRGLAEALADRAAGRPLVVAVDDAHLLDPGSAALVHHLAANRGATLVICVRGGEPCPDAIVGLWKDRLVERVDLGPLSGPESDRMIEALLGDPVDAPTARRIAGWSSGNALYLRELVRGAVEGGDLERREGLWHGRRELPIGPRLTELLERRLDAIDADSREALEILALAEPIEIGRLAALVGEGPAAGLEQQGLLEVRADGGRSEAHFSHPLYGEVLRRRMPRLLAARHRRRLCAEFERTPIADADLIRVARWRLESGSAARPAELVAASLRAAASFDPQLATRLAAAAVELDDNFAARQALGEARTACGQSDLAEDDLALAATLAEDDEQRARNAVSRADNLFWRLGDADRAVAAIGVAEEAVATPPARASLRAARATMLLFGGETAAATELSRAMAAEADPSLPVAWQSAFTAAWGLTCGGKPDDAVALLDRFLALAACGAALPPPFSPLLLQINRSSALGFSGRLAEALAEGKGAYAAAVEAGAENPRAIAALATATTLRTRGEVAAAARLLREAVAELREVDLFRHLSATLGELAHTEALLGDARAADAALAEAEATRATSFRMDEWSVGLGRAWVAAGRGESSAAIAAARATAAITGDCGQHTMQALCLHDALRLGDDTAAADLIEVCADVQGDLPRAYSAHAGARAAGDGAALLDAAAGFTALGATLLAADATADAARAFATEHRDDEAQAATARAGALRARCDGALTPALVHLAMPRLSPRQREIATLAARGMSNREIATRLVVSVRTVENHLYAVYTRLGVSSRNDLAATLGVEPL